MNIRFIEATYFRWRNFTFKKGYWVYKSITDGYWYAGSGWRVGDMFYAYRLHRFGAPEPVGWVEMPSLLKYFEEEYY